MSEPGGLSSSCLSVWTFPFVLGTSQSQIWHDGLSEAFFPSPEVSEQTLPMEYLRHSPLKEETFFFPLRCGDQGWARFESRFSHPLFLLSGARCTEERFSSGAMVISR